jgi:hypothetical protein
MSEQISHIHPRKLYASLRESADPAARASAALEFLRDCAAADSGFLFLVHAKELVLAASTGKSAPPAGLVEQAAKTWVKELDMQPEGGQTRTIDVSQLVAAAVADESPAWKFAPGESFVPRLLSVYRDSRWSPVGLSVLKPRLGQPLLPVRAVHVEAICNAFIDAGDVSSSRTSLEPRTR